MLNRIRGKSRSVWTYVIFGFIIVSFVFLGVGRFTGSFSSAVVVVNGEDISVQDFYKNAMQIYQNESRNRPELASDAAMKEQLKRQVLERMMADLLIQQEAKKLGIFVSPGEAVQALSSITFFQNEKGELDEERYNKALAEMGLPRAKFEADLLNDILRNKVLAAVAMSVVTTEAEAKSFFQFKLEQRVAEYVLFATKDYMSKAEVTDDDLKAYYESNTTRFQEPARMNIESVVVTPKTLAAGFSVNDDEVKAYYDTRSDEFAIPEQYKVRHILITAPPPGATDEASVKEIAKAEETVRGLLKELKDGADFSELVKKHSQDFNSVPAGGDIGWLAKGDQIVPAFENAALALKPGQMSDAVRTEYGFHIIKMDDKKPAGKVEFDKVKDEIKSVIALEKATKEEDTIKKAIVEDLNNAVPFADIAKKYSLKVETTGMVEKDSLVKRLGLHVDAMPVIENVPVGEAAPAPVNVVDGQALVKVLDSTPSRVLSFDEVKDRVRDIVSNDKATLLARKAAEEALPAFTGNDVPAAYAEKVQESTPFSRAVPFVMPFGMVQSLSDALNGMHPGPWAPRTFDVQEGTIITRVKEIIPASEEDWTKQGEMVFNAVVQGNQSAAVQIFLKRLLDNGKVEVNEDLVAQVELK